MSERRLPGLSRPSSESSAGGPLGSSESHGALRRPLFQAHLKVAMRIRIALGPRPVGRRVFGPAPADFPKALGMCGKGLLRPGFSCSAGACAASRTCTRLVAWSPGTAACLEASYL